MKCGESEETALTGIRPSHSRAVRRQIRGNTWSCHAQPVRAAALLSQSWSGRRVLTTNSAQTKKPQQRNREPDSRAGLFQYKDNAITRGSHILFYTSTSMSRWPSLLHFILNLLNLRNKSPDLLTQHRIALQVSALED